MPEDPTPELRAAVVTALDDALLCTRVWEAWSVGTMRADDFTDAADDPEFVDQLVEAVRPALATAHQHAIEDAVTYLEAMGHPQAADCIRNLQPRRVEL